MQVSLPVRCRASSAAQGLEQETDRGSGRGYSLRECLSTGPTEAYGEAESMDDGCRRDHEGAYAMALSEGWNLRVGGKR